MLIGWPEENDGSIAYGILDRKAGHTIPAVGLDYQSGYTISIYADFMELDVVSVVTFQNYYFSPHRLFLQQLYMKLQT